MPNHTNTLTHYNQSNSVHYAPSHPNQPHIPIHYTPYSQHPGQSHIPPPTTIPTGNQHSLFHSLLPSLFSNVPLAPTNSPAQTDPTLTLPRLIPSQAAVHYQLPTSTPKQHHIPYNYTPTPNPSPQYPSHSHPKSAPHPLQLHLYPQPRPPLPSHPHPKSAPHPPSHPLHATDLTYSRPVSNKLIILMRTSNWIIGGSTSGVQDFVLLLIYCWMNTQRNDFKFYARWPPIHCVYIWLIWRMAALFLWGKPAESWIFGELLLEYHSVASNMGFPWGTEQVLGDRTWYRTTP